MYKPLFMQLSPQVLHQHNLEPVGRFYMCFLKYIIYLSSPISVCWLHLLLRMMYFCSTQIQSSRMHCNAWLKIILERAREGGAAGKWDWFVVCVGDCVVSTTGQHRVKQGADSPHILDLWAQVWAGSLGILSSPSCASAGTEQEQEEWMMEGRQKRRINNWYNITPHPLAQITTHTHSLLDWGTIQTHTCIN